MKTTKALAVAVLLMGAVLLGEAVVAAVVGRLSLAFIAGGSGAAVVAYSWWSSL